MSNKYSYKQQQSHSTNHSNHHTPKLNKEKYVSPFPITERHVSPLRKRLQNSPLHIPLAIAIKKLGQGVTSRQFISHCQSSVNGQLQNIKNILQQFGQSLYLSIERQLYSKFNIEMKRIIIKYRQTQKLLHKVQDKLAFNADVLSVDQLFKKRLQQHRKIVQQLQGNNQLLAHQLRQQTHFLNEAIAEKKKIQQQNGRMCLKIQKLQNILLRRIQEIQQYKSYIHSLKQQSERASAQQSMSSFASHHQNSEYASLSMTNSHICNLNQLTPSQSPIQKKKLKLKNHAARPTSVSVINLKKAQN